MYRTLLSRTAAAVAALGALALVSTAASAATAPVVAPGYTLTVVARGTSTMFNPDSVTTDGAFIYVGFQNGAAADGSSGSSNVVQYDSKGAIRRVWTLAGKCDGLRIDPRTGRLWALTNEDANPHLTIIDPRSGRMTPYAFPAPPHNGGYDDLAFTPHGVFVSASNPNPEPPFHYPAVDRVELEGGQVDLTPVLYDDSTAVNRTTGQTVQLQLSDPDSLSVASNGDIILDSQADQLHVILHDPGTDDQRNEVLPLSDQVDDSAQVTRRDGRLLIADHAGNTVYFLSREDGFDPGTVYSAAPNDSTIPGIVGTLNTRTGVISPVVTGLSDPHGTIFIPERGGDR